jgi:hypothetical protein
MSLTWGEASWWRSGRWFAVACIAMAGCTEPRNPAVGREGSAVVQRADRGTEIFAGTAEVTGQTCNGGTGSVTIEGTLTTTGSVDSVEITASVNGATATLVGTIEPQDFTHEGRIKWAPYSITIDGLPNGTDTVQVCFDQSGSQGREPKHTCADVVVVVVNCSVCSGTGFFGDLVGNTNLCQGNGPPHIPVHVKGDLGESPALTITGPNGYSFHAFMNHSGESCVYQYNWDTAGNGGAGDYTFAVSGGGNSYSFTATLRCH